MKSSSNDGEDEEDEEEVDGDDGGGVNVADLVPRNDIRYTQFACISVKKNVIGI